jgi:hypothetical protein
MEALEEFRPGPPYFLGFNDGKLYKAFEEYILD